MSNRRSDAIRDERFLIEFALSDDAAFFSSEIGEVVGVTRQQARNRLADLEERGLLTSKKASGRRIWWITEDGEAHITRAARAAFE